MQKTGITKLLVHSFSLALISLNFSCSGRSFSELIGSSQSSLALQSTIPSLDETSSKASYTFKWTGAEGIVRATNPYHVNIFSQANCAGAPLAESYVSTNQYVASNLVDGSVRSIGITAYDASGKASSEVCSKSIQTSAIVSKLIIPGGVYLSLDYDANKNMAYLGANKPGTLFDAIDVADETNPIYFRNIGTGSTPSSAQTYVRGVASYKNGQRLIVASNNGTLELWDFTADPRSGGWTQLANIGGLSNAKKIAKVDTTNPLQTVVYVVLRGGLAIVNIAEPAGTMSIASSGGAYTQLQSGTILGGWMLTGSASFENAYLMNLATFAADVTYSLPSTGAGQFLWSSVSSADNKKAFVAGTTSGFFTYNPATPAVAPVLVSKYDSGPNTIVRDAVFVVENGKDLIYGVRQNGFIDVWDATSMLTPVLIQSQMIPNYISTGGNEAYAIRVNPITHRAYIASAAGEFYIINTQMLRPPVTPPVPY